MKIGNLDVHVCTREKIKIFTKKTQKIYSEFKEIHQNLAPIREDV